MHSLEEAHSNFVELVLDSEWVSDQDNLYYQPQDNLLEEGHCYRIWPKLKMGVLSPSVESSLLLLKSDDHSKVAACSEFTGLISSINTTNKVHI